jgi:hypothetical protein
MVQLAPKATAFIEVTFHLPGSAKISWKLQPVDGCKDSVRDIFADPGL